MILAALAVVSCAGRSDNDLRGDVSNTTGWKYNDKKSTGFEVQHDFTTTVPPGMVPVEGGTFTIGEKGEFITAPRNNQQRDISVNSFYMDKYEVTNLNWREYEHWMKIVFEGTAPSLVRKVRPDVTVWREELAYNEPYVENYYEHPAFNNYPVVGVTWLQAMDYCRWRTDRVNEMALISNGLIAPPDFSSLDPEYGMEYDSIAHGFVFNTQKYLLDKTYEPEPGKRNKEDLFGNPRRVEMSDGIFLCSSYRLPTEAEWEFAAYAPLAGEEGLTIEGKIYPWSGYGARSINKKIAGQLQANFVRGKGDYMGVSKMLNDHHVITAPVNSYCPNDYGLYNMAGNVNEWVLDVYRETSFQDMVEYNSFRGNMYVEPKITEYDDEGNPTYGIDSVGCIVMEIKDKKDDVRNYIDGDSMSLIDTDFPLHPDSATLAALDPDRLIDPTDVLAPKVTVDTRVYKGGSWKDRVYWLNPSTRRYLDQDKCASTIGFRCAMSTVGSETFYDEQ